MSDYQQGLKQLVGGFLRKNLYGMLPGFFDNTGTFQVVSAANPLPVTGGGGGGGGATNGAASPSTSTPISFGNAGGNNQPVNNTNGLPVQVIAGEIEDTIWFDNNRKFFIYRDIGTPSAPNFVAIDPLNNRVYLPGAFPRPAEHNDNVTGIGSTLSASPLSVQYAAITAGGANYVLGDLITVVGGTSATPAVGVVTGVSATGAVTAISFGLGFCNIGQYSVMPANPASTTVAQGTGSGCTLTLSSATAVGFMLDSTGYSVLLANLQSNSAGSSTIIEGSIDGGQTWFAIAWGFGASETYQTGQTGSWSLGTNGTARTVYPLTRMRFISATNGSCAWCLKSLPVDQQAVITQQGPNQGSNYYWYQTQQASPFGAPYAYATVIATATTNAVYLGFVTRFYNITLYNTDTVPYYLKLYNKTSTPVPGTDTPYAVYTIPANGALILEAGSMGMQPSNRAQCGYAITLNPALLDATAVTNANKVVGSILTG